MSGWLDAMLPRRMDGETVAAGAFSVTYLGQAAVAAQNTSGTLQAQRAAAAARLIEVGFKPDSDEVKNLLKEDTREAKALEKISNELTNVMGQVMPALKTPF